MQTERSRLFRGIGNAVLRKRPFAAVFRRAVYFLSVRVVKRGFRAVRFFDIPLVQPGDFFGGIVVSIVLAFFAVRKIQLRFVGSVVRFDFQNVAQFQIFEFYVSVA